MDKLKDMIKTHIFNGLSETYRTVNQMTEGKRTLMAFQVALECIRELSRNKLNTDYNVLLQMLHRNNYDESSFERTIKNAFYEYARRALQSAGLECDKLNLDLIDVPNGMDFVHLVYINTAREVWTQPHLFAKEYPASVQLENQRKVLVIIEASIERTVRDSVDLNKIITAYQTGTVMPTKRKIYEPTLKEKFNQINRNKTLLDDSTMLANEQDSDDLVVEAVRHISNPSSSSSSSLNSGIKKLSNAPPPTPSTIGAATIDNDDMAPDTETIDTSGDMRIDMTKFEEPGQSIDSKDKDTVSILTVSERSKKVNPVNRNKIKKTIQPADDEELMVIELDPSTKYVPNNNTEGIKVVRKRAKKISTANTDSDSNSDSNSNSASNSSIETIKAKPPVNNNDSISMLPDSIGEPVELIEEDTNTELDIMFKNSGKPKPKPVPEPTIDNDNDVKSFEYGSASVSATSDAQTISSNSLNICLLDEKDEVESRLSRLRSRKSAILSMGIE